MKYKSIYVACSRGEADPCGPAEVFEAASLEEAVQRTKERNLELVAEDLAEDEELDELDTEFFTETGTVGELGWAECGEEGMVLVVPETSKWFELFTEGDSWDEQTWSDFDEILGAI